MITHRLFVALTLVACLNRVAARGDEPPIGFAPASRPILAKTEAQALAIPNPTSARTWLRALTEEPHVAGTPADYKTALYVRDKLRSWGWTADLAEYQVLLNYPHPDSVRLEIVRPERQELKVTEDPHPADKDSASADAFPAFHGYGVSGDVTGQVVYANYGRPEDFDTLERLGVDVAGKIVLVRYGELFRGLKVRNAQKRGAIGVLIYSDPAEDGYTKGDVYPNGPFRPESAIQRGSVQFLSLGPGDPTTPGVASVLGAKRLPHDTDHGFPLHDVEAWERDTGLNREDYFATIPSLPISYEAARPIFEALGGPNTPNGWQGGLPLSYHLGPGPCEVHFGVRMDYQVRPVWNVIARIAGTVEPDRWVLIGNHRDAWTYGAVDPSSGTAATLEACRALGEAVKAGWKPRRSLMYASWDAEEYGLVGSTEWAEQNSREIQDKAVLLLNVDVAVGGVNLEASGVPSLRDLFLQAAEGVMDPRTGRSLRDAWLATQRGRWANSAPVDLDPRVWEAAKATVHDPFQPQLDPLGSGSDYTAFLDHLGVPALDLGFKGRYGVYHSIYDDFFWMEQFGDPEFLTHVTSAKLFTAIALRAAGADVVPLHFTPYGEALRDYVDDLRRIVARKARTGDRKVLTTFDGLENLIEAVQAFQRQAAALDRATAALANQDGVAPEALARVNDALMAVERSFLLPQGLPDRPWFKHAIYAPGLTTGYACWPLPGVRQAILSNDKALLASQMPALIDRLQAATAALQAATKLAADPANR
jgi:N-acetylated-alpha-linked acidic dipeptidase